MDELQNAGSHALPFARAGGDEVNLPRAHGQYSVYLNNQFVGHKTLLRQVESPDDIGSYLERCNIGQFTTDVDGDHYKISATQDSVARQIRTHLNAYLDTHTTGVTSDQPGF
ncbi:hypothetical protein NZD89_11030 [Alicyclobacillus fastidiosus]|uniref:Uncharacterized protein n=1 Tax=Alicyclobacillus fastidiosus TaxID=392011 RepID=A0ABY6ZNZ3_9BACL|nr:hypothetical protein [Alicyclobacillus fastidiosus]WAH43866.1 hypothetical protein NZD89_11030 [Alicyclobacillus fastidiosus]GMA60104.1 hypothetical protein GCM10025859_05440 [Alicyclobacillus fastidiosus]